MVSRDVNGADKILFTTNILSLSQHGVIIVESFSTSVGPAIFYGR